MILPLKADLRSQAPQLRSLSLALFLAALGGCHESNSPGVSQLGTQSLDVNFLNVAPGEIQVPLNRPIVVSFSRPIDFDTVNANTFQIAALKDQIIDDPANPGHALDVGGLRVFGDFERVDERTVRFEPACPISESFGAGAFIPGVEYALRLLSLTDDGSSILSTDGQAAILEPFELTFLVAAGSDPAQLYIDESPEPPRPYLQDGTSSEIRGSRLIVGGDSTSPLFFEASDVDEFARLATGARAPLNLYSDPRSSFEVVLAFDQPLSPSAANIHPTRIRLELSPQDATDSWNEVPADVFLESNCGDRRTEVKLVPLGPLPQDHELRVVLDPELLDLFEVPIATEALIVAHFRTGVEIDPATGQPGDAVDEIFEPFLTSGDQPGSREDTDVEFEVPAAQWGGDEPGSLRPNRFEGTGGPGGEFDLVIPGGVTTIFNTNQQAFFGGPGGLSVHQQLSLDGVLHVRDLTVQAGATWVLSGSNPVTILASGDVQIDGRVSANGRNASSVDFFAMAHLPEAGALGTAGGGRGGVGSPLATQSSPQGGSGTGGIDYALGGGGGGGESGISTVSTNNGENRRPGGGGGGVFGADVVFSSGCPDESRVGMNVEPGHEGNSTQAGGAVGAVHGLVPPRGGIPGPGPFSDARADNNFYGTLLSVAGTAEPVRGELDRPWAGAGGGAGGDATNYNSAIGYPDPNFPLSREDKGAGGGGGGGGIQIIALGAIRFGPAGRIEVTGGNGAGGENTSFINRVGGGSGGGSGGHVVLQSATAIDFSQSSVVQPECLLGSTASECLAITALGGWGGVGAGNLGGADPSNPNPPQTDAIPDLLEGCLSNPRVCAGGDGGPGIIQLHAPSVNDILAPGGDPANLGSILSPPPIGFDRDAEAMTSWLLPEFHPRSRAQSKWISIGLIHLGSESSTEDLVEYLFRGIDPLSGIVRTQDGYVQGLDPVLDGVLATGPETPYLSEDGGTLVFDVTQLSGERSFYRRNPRLLQAAVIELDRLGITERFEVVFAESDELAGELRLTAALSDSGAKLSDFARGTPVRVVPRFFGVRTGDVLEQLPDSAQIRIRFQGAPADREGAPDEERASPWSSDPESLTNFGASTPLRFLRFQVEFDLAADGAPTSVETPAPSLEFLRIPYRF